MCEINLDHDDDGDDDDDDLHPCDVIRHIPVNFQSVLNFQSCKFCYPVAIFRQYRIDIVWKSTKCYRSITDGINISSTTRSAE